MYINFLSILPAPGLVPRENSLALQPGQVLPARLLSAADGNNTMQLAGRTYAAKGSLPTELGPFWIQVQTVDPAVIQVKVLPTRCGEDLDIQILFEALGIKPNNETKNVVQQLLRWRLPLSQELVQEFISSAKGIPPRARPAFWAGLAFLHSLTCKEDPGKVDAALKYIMRRPEATPDGQEVINQACPLYPDQEVVRVLTFQMGQSEGEVFIISCYQGQEGPPENNQPQSLVIRFSTTTWGQVWIQLFIQGRNLTAKVMAEDNSFLSLAQAAELELKNRCRSIGWELAALTTAQQEITTIAELVEPHGPENYRPLDALV